MDALPRVDRRWLLTGGAVAATALMARLARGGPINPPVGPVAPTPGPEPRIPISDSTTPGDSTAYFKITQPGSYFLTKNLTGLANKAAIAIAAQNVTLDLNGFSILGTPVSGSFVLTLITDNADGLVVRNGWIRAWSAYLTLNQIRNATFEDLNIVGPYAGNLEATGRHCIYRRLMIESTGEIGISAAEDSIIEDCVVTRQTGGTGGLSVGIAAFGNCIVQRCVVAGCGNGITALGSIVRDCVVQDASAASSWDDAGILMQRGVVENCAVSGCARAGIRLTGSSTALNNHVFACQTGITDGGFAGNRNRIEGNNVSFCSGVGIKLEKPRNLVARNVVSQSTTADYDIIAGNAVGEILDMIGGGTMGGSIGAWANVRL